MQSLRAPLGWQATGSSPGMPGFPSSLAGPGALVAGKGGAGGLFLVIGMLLQILLSSLMIF